MQKLTGLLDPSALSDPASLAAIAAHFGIVLPREALLGIAANLAMLRDHDGRLDDLLGRRGPA